MKYLIIFTTFLSLVAFSSAEARPKQDSSKRERGDFRLKDGLEHSINILQQNGPCGVEAMEQPGGFKVRYLENANGEVSTLRLVGSNGNDVFRPRAGEGWDSNPMPAEWLWWIGENNPAQGLPEPTISNPKELCLLDFYVYWPRICQVPSAAGWSTNELVCEAAPYVIDQVSFIMCAGDDVIDLSACQLARDPNISIHAHMGRGNDLIVTGEGSDKIYGGRGNDAAWSGTGSDLINGGNGYDSVFYNSDGFDTLLHLETFFEL